MGLGNALFEEVRYEEGQLRMPTRSSTACRCSATCREAFHVDIIENGDGPGPFGAKGMSQTSIPCVAPAINNAIADAIGVHVAPCPLRPRRCSAPSAS